MLFTSMKEHAPETDKTIFSKHFVVLLADGFEGISRGV